MQFNKEEIDIILEDFYKSTHMLCDLVYKLVDTDNKHLVPENVLDWCYKNDDR